MDANECGGVWQTKKAKLFLQVSLGFDLWEKSKQLFLGLTGLNFVYLSFSNFTRILNV